MPVIAGSSGYMIAELFNIPEGLHQKLRQAPGFYGVILLGLLAGTVMDIVHVDAIKALFWSAVSNGVAAVPLVYAIIRVSQNANVLGKWVASPAATGWLWLTFALMLLSAAGMFVMDSRLVNGRSSLELGLASRPHAPSGELGFEITCAPPRFRSPHARLRVTACQAPSDEGLRPADRLAGPLRVNSFQSPSPRRKHRSECCIAC